MSTDPDQDAPATMECRVCQTDVPAGEFCGLCGDYLTPRRGNGPSWLRIRAYGAAPGEHLLLPSLASSLFPHLPHRSRMPFRVVLILVLLALVTFATLRMPAALITVAALGLPLLFLLYMRETDAYRDLPTRTLLLTAALGIGLGVGWVLLTGAMVARSYGVPLGAGIAGDRIVREGLGVSVGGLIVMLVPAVVVRLTRPPTRESLDGFMIGALGALDLHRGRHADPVGAAIRDGDDFPQPPHHLAHHRGGHPRVGGPVDRRGRRRPRRCGAVVHPPGEQGRPAHGLHTRRAGLVRRVGNGRVRRTGPRRRRRDSTSAAAGYPSVGGRGGTSAAADRPSSRAAARSARRDPLR